MSAAVPSVSAKPTAAPTPIPEWRKIPGIPPNFVHPRDTDPNYQPEDIRKELLILAIVLLVCAAATVFLRLYAKIHFRQKIEIADWLMIPAIVFCTGYIAANMVAVIYGGCGRHLWDNTLDQFKIYIMASSINQAFYFVSIYCTKISIILFVRQVIGHAIMRPLKIAVDSLLIISCLYFPTAIIILYTRCQPHPRALFDLEARKKYGCSSPLGSQQAIFYGIAGFHSVLDVATLILPFFILHQVRVQRKEKFVLFFLFGLGIVACTCACLRLVYYARGWDSTWEIWRAYTFGTLETTLAPICVCVPQLRKLAGHVGGKIASSVSWTSATTTSTRKTKDGSGIDVTYELRQTSAKNSIVDEEGLPFRSVPQDIGKNSLTNIHVTNNSYNSR